MSPDLKITLTPEAVELLRSVKRIPEKCLQAIRQAHDQVNAMAVGTIVKKRLSFPKQGPTTMEGLRAISTRLRRSVRPSLAVISGQKVISSIGSNIKYAAIHEFGGKTSKHPIVAQGTGALRFTIGGRVIFRKRVDHPGSDIPARAPFRRGIEECLPLYRAAISKAVTDNIKLDEP